MDRLLSEQDILDAISRVGLSKRDFKEVLNAVEALTPLTPDVLANMLMQERIGGELKQDISYSKDVIDNVRCKLTVEIIDHRPAYCGSQLREVWREDE